jgi:hypothetical protein
MLVFLVTDQILYPTATCSDTEIRRITILAKAGRGKGIKGTKRLQNRRQGIRTWLSVPGCPYLAVRKAPVSIRPWALEGLTR